jgi:hypothetical protein
MTQSVFQILCSCTHVYGYEKSVFVHVCNNLIRRGSACLNLNSPLSMPPTRCCYCDRNLLPHQRRCQASPAQLQRASLYRESAGLSPLKHAEHICPAHRRHPPKAPQTPKEIVVRTTLPLKDNRNSENTVRQEESGDGASCGNFVL